MDIAPDPVALPPDQPSLADRLAMAIRRRKPHAQDRRPGREIESAGAANPRLFGILLAVLLPAGPVLAWSAATIQTAVIHDRAKALRRAAAPALAARAAAMADRAALATAAPGIADIANAFARILPPDTRLAAVAADERGRLSADAATPDPDTLRAALRRDPRTARLRDIGQTRGDGIIVVRLREGSR